MKRGRLLKPVLWLTAACIILPAIVLLIWCFAARWPWPGILPESLSLRTVKELIFGSAKLPKLLLSSISLSFAVAAISTTIGIATARATELYEFRGKGLIRFFSLLPLLVPGTVLAIGAQIMLLKVGLGDSIAGIILIHTVASVPYCITIMTDVTAALGDKFEEQAATLGAGPFRAFFEVTLPNLMPGIMSSFSMGFIISYSQYFTTLIIGGGRINTISLVLVPYIQGGDRSLASVYAMAFSLSALGVFAMLELLIYNVNKEAKEPMLEVNGLFVDIKGQPILKGVDFSVKGGELMGLLGPSGCGKSTLLKAVAGILPPKSGSILIGGEDMANVPPHKRGAVIVFQDMRLFPNMTALENVAFPIKMQGVPKRQRLEQAGQLMKSVQLCGLESRRINELSGGQQQRVALARALAAQPRLLLLDEPFTALDNELKEEIRALVLELHKKFRTTTVLVTHDRQEAFAMADGIAVMRDGRVMRQGSRDEMAAHLGNKEGEA